MQNAVTTEDVVDFITSAAWAIHITSHMVLGSTHCQAIFSRDMLFNILYLADEKWENVDK